MALYTLGTSEWKNRAWVLHIQWCFKPILTPQPPSLGDLSVSSHTIFHPPLVLGMPLIVWKMSSYSLNTLAYYYGLPLHELPDVILGNILSLQYVNFMISWPSHLQSPSPLYFSHPLWRADLHCGITAPPLKTWIQLFCSLTTTSYPSPPALSFSDSSVNILYIHWVLQLLDDSIFSLSSPPILCFLPIHIRIHNSVHQHFLTNILNTITLTHCSSNSSGLGKKNPSPGPIYVSTPSIS